MSQSTKPCLILIADRDCTQLKKALLESQRLISSWVVFNPFEIAHADIIKSNIASITLLEGHIVSEQPWLGIGAFLEQAKDIASKWSESMLWLRGPEQIALLSDSAEQELGLIDEERAAYLLVRKGEMAIAELRLFSTQPDYLISGEVLPVVNAGLTKYCSLKTSIIRNGDTLMEKLPTNSLLLEAQRQQTLDSALELGIYSALLKLSMAEPGLAAQILLDICDEAQESSAELRWTHQYLSGVCQLAQGRTNDAVEFFSGAIDVDSERLEAYARLIEILLTAEQGQAAAELATVAEGLDWPVNAHYIEPVLHDRDFAILQLKAYAMAEQRDKGQKIYQTLNSYCNKNEKIKEALALFDKVRQTQSGVSPSNSAAADRKLASTANYTSTTEPQADAETTTDAQAIAPKLTIGMATYDDFDGVYFTLMSIKLFHSECLDQIELLVVDNNPDSAHGKAVKNLVGNIGARYLPASEFSGTTVRERVFLEARGDFVMCVDCHVFLIQGVIARLLEYIDANPNSKDIWHGPMMGEDMKGFSTHMSERWQQGFYGVFESDERAKDIDGERFEIPMQGLAMFVCKRSEWAGFNRKFRGFGAEEGYIHYKFALNGGKTWCLPFMRWMHRFPRPNGVKYRIRWEDRIRNYLIGWSEIGRDTQSVYDHYSQQLSPSVMAEVHRSLEAERASPFWGFDSIYQLYQENTWDALDASLLAWGINNSAQKIEYKNTEHPLNTALLRVLNLAERQHLPNVIVLTGKLPTEPDARAELNPQLRALSLGAQSVKCLQIHESDTDDAQILYIRSDAYAELKAAYSDQNITSLCEAAQLLPKLV